MKANVKSYTEKRNLLLTYFLMDTWPFDYKVKDAPGVTIEDVDSH